MELASPKREDAAVGGDEPVALARRRRGDADDRRLSPTSTPKRAAIAVVATSRRRSIAPTRHTSVARRHATERRAALRVRTVIVPTSPSRQAVIPGTRLRTRCVARTAKASKWSTLRVSRESVKLSNRVERAREPSLLDSQSMTTGDA